MTSTTLIFNWKMDQSQVTIHAYKYIVDKDM